jgi:hypothetical protein
MHVCTVVAGEHGLDRLREPFEPVDAADEDVLNAALFEVGEDLHPEFRALVGLEPYAEHVSLAVHVDGEREVAGAALHAAAIADLQHERVQEHDRVDVVQRPGLPRARVLHHRVGDLADEIAADLDAVELGQVRLDVPRREATAIEREDLLVEPLKAALALSDQLGLEAAVTITRRVDPDRPVLGRKRLRC